MLAYCLLALLALGVSADHHEGHGEHPRLTCADIPAFNDVDYAALSGNWVAVEGLKFNDGHPWTPANPEDDHRPKTCMYLKKTAEADSGMKVTIEAHVTGQDLKTEVLTATKIGEEKGRLSFTSDKHDRENWEFVVLDADPAKYMVYMLCQPPTASGERLPLRVNLLSRHADHSDHEVITADEELQIEKKIGEKLHLTGSGIKAVKYNHDCWASYAEPQ